MYKALLLTVTLILAPAMAGANTMFTYQGQLDDGGSPFDGTVEMEFELFDADSGGNQQGGTITELVNVTDGLFQVELDFGNQSFDAASGLWLEITVEGEILTPRQRITAAPLAIRSLDGGGLWIDELSGISYSAGNVAVGHPATGAPQALSVRSMSGVDPFSALTQAGIRGLHVHDNAGVTVGGFFLAPDSGLMVHGDVEQEPGSTGLVKAAALVRCSTAATAEVIRSFKNVPTSTTDVTVTGLNTGRCRVDFGFDLSERYWQVTPARSPASGDFESAELPNVGNCHIWNQSTNSDVLTCGVRVGGSSGFVGTPIMITIY